ncbi:MAG: LysR family transcriptional regulator [Eggerthellaceae bacterium]|nr:LysR family transcriptional regulator [Eggerthellaceae bacterium]
MRTLLYQGYFPIGAGEVIGEESGQPFMLTTYLEEYLELVSTMNYTVAARRLNITQSALSKHIAALEKEFDATFIDRSKQQIELTQQGRAFCEEASKMLDAYHSARRRLHDALLEVKIAGALRDSAVNNIRSRAQDLLRDADKAIRVAVHDYATSTFAEALKDGKVDLVIDIMPQADLATSPPDPALDVQFLTSVPLIAVVLRTHRLGAAESVSIQELADERIMHPTGSLHIQEGSSIIEGIFARHGIKLRKRIFFANSWNEFPSVDLGDDVFIMPRSLYSRQLFGSQLFDALHGIPLSDEDARFPYGISTRKDERDPAVLRYADALLKAARTIETS